MALAVSYQQDRLTTPSTRGRTRRRRIQIIDSRVGIASGGVGGVGLARRAKWGFLPESETDFISPSWPRRLA